MKTKNLFIRTLVILSLVVVGLTFNSCEKTIDPTACEINNTGTLAIMNNTGKDGLVTVEYGVDKDTVLTMYSGDNIEIDLPVGLVRVYGIMGNYVTSTVSRDIVQCSRSVVDLSTTTIATSRVKFVNSTGTDVKLILNYTNLSDGLPVSRDISLSVDGVFDEEISTNSIGTTVKIYDVDVIYDNVIITNLNGETLTVLDKNTCDIFFVDVITNSNVEWYKLVRWVNGTPENVFIFELPTYTVNNIFVVLSSENTESYYNTAGSHWYRLVYKISGLIENQYKSIPITYNRGTIKTVTL